MDYIEYKNEVKEYLLKYGFNEEVVNRMILSYEDDIKEAHMENNNPLLIAEIIVQNF